MPTGFQRMDRRPAVEKSRMTSAQPGEDGGRLPRSMTQRAVEMTTSAAISTGVGARSHAAAQQERRRCPRTIIHHAGARAAPGSCAAERCASEAQPCLTTLWTGSAMLPHTLQVLLYGHRCRHIGTVAGAQDHVLPPAVSPDLDPRRARGWHRSCTAQRGRHKGEGTDEA